MIVFPVESVLLRAGIPSSEAWYDRGSTFLLKGFLTDGALDPKPP